MGNMKQKEKAIHTVQALLTDLKSCSLKRDLQWGRGIHKKAVESQNDANMYVRTALIKMYGKCGSMVDARRVFDSIQRQDVVSWTTLLLGYAENAEGRIALDLFSRMKASQGCMPDSVTYVAALKACTSLANGNTVDKLDCLGWGREIHSEVGDHLDHYVKSALIDMYATCASMTDAREVFDGILKPNVFSWTALILGYAENGEGHAALDLFSRMKATGACAPDSVTYVAALRACTALVGDGSGKKECLERGREIHLEIGRHLNNYVQNTLIDMYAKCGNMFEARQVFDSMLNPDVVSWNALILGYAENEKGQSALDLFSKMKALGFQPNSLTYVAALRACTSLVINGDGNAKVYSLDRGRVIHAEIGPHSNHYVQTTLIDLYANCGSIKEAHQVFDTIQKPDVVSWNALILGYAENEKGQIALNLFSRMKAAGECVPNSITYLAALKACASLAVNGSGKGDYCLELGREIHSEIGCHLNRYVLSALIDMYANCGSMVDAHKVFKSIKNPDVVSWNALILGYVENDEGHAALDLFTRMKATSECAPNSVTYVAALKSCTCMAINGYMEECLEVGRDIHLEIGGQLNRYVQNTLIDMYANCRSMVEAHQVFDSIQGPDVVSWNTLILGYVGNGDGHAALDLFSRMKAAHGCAPDSLTYVAVIKACGLIGALTLGRTFHSDMTEFSSHVVTCLVAFYAKCGSMVEACEVFDLHSTARTVSTWNALLAGYGSYGDNVSVFKLFETMQDQGFEPDAVTFVCVLSCCSHAGLVQKAREYFEAMPVHYGVTPTLMHYTCMVDVLGRANQLKEAIVVLRRMPYNPSAVTWMTLLGACRKYKNVEVGRWAFQSLVDMDKKNAPAYVLMAQIYGVKLPQQIHVPDEVGKMVKFVVREDNPQEVKDELEHILEGIKQQGQAKNLSTYNKC